MIKYISAVGIGILFGFLLGLTYRWTRRIQEKNRKEQEAKE